jgi:malonyl-CoA/methylmalonyl-CoA synthetase
MNLFEKLHNSMVDAPHKVLKFEDREYIFEELDKNIKKAACFLKNLGIEHQDRVAIQLEKSMEFIYFHYANLALGAITLPLNPSYSEKEVEYFLSDSESKLFATNNTNAKRLKSVTDKLNIKVVVIEDIDLSNYNEEISCFDANDDDVAVIAYTSGTTGRSKGAMITHSNLINNMEALRKLWRFSENDKLLHTLPIFHVHGLIVALQGAINAKSDIVMYKKFDPERVWQTIEDEKITMFMGVPTLYQRLVDAWEKMDKKPNISSMRIFISGSAPLPDILFKRFYKITGHRILERYGMSEAGMIASNPYEEEKRIPKSVGYPLEGCKIKIVKDKIESKAFEVGEVYIKGNNVFKGYWQMPQKTEESFENGWFKTGDLGYMDETGRLFLVSRAKELIITGGLNVYPKEVEYAIEEHKDVKESAVFGIKDRDFGERVEACVVLNKKNSADEKSIIEFCKKRLAHYKCPKRIHIVDEIPKNAMGKIQKNVLIERFTN